MAMTAYLKVTGKSQSEIKGGCMQAGDKKDSMLIYKIEHMVEIPKDTHTGLPTGQRIHHPLTVWKAVDCATPKLYKALCTGEQCEVVLDLYRIKEDGTEEKYFTTKLESAIIVKMTRDTPYTFLPENKPFHDMESVSFTYAKITWTYNDGNIEFVDSWQDR